MTDAADQLKADLKSVDGYDMQDETIDYGGNDESTEDEEDEQS